jgi:hypothetical protein
MPDDIRIRIGFLDHPKTLRIINRFGMAAVGHLFALWEYVAKFCPKGTIDGISEQDLERVCRYSGVPGTLFSFLVDHQWIDAFPVSGESYRIAIHDWKDNQPWVYFSPERSKKARKSVEIRWKNHFTKRKRNVDVSYPSSSRDSDTPTPLPTPTPIPNTRPKKAAAPSQPMSEAAAIYRDTFHVSLNKIQREAVDKIVASEGAIELWRETLRGWAMKGWSKMNVDGMLDCFTKGGITKRDESSLNQTQRSVLESRRRRLEREGNGDSGQDRVDDPAAFGGAAGQEAGPGSHRHLPAAPDRHPQRGAGDGDGSVPHEVQVLPDDRGDQGDGEADPAGVELEEPEVLD